MVARNAKNKLTNLAVKSFVSKDLKGSKLFDGGGLFITIPLRGQASWRVRYKLMGKEKLFTIGVYPEISISEARVVRAQVMNLVKQGLDPVTQRRLDKLSNQESSSNTFSTIAEQWLLKKKAEWSQVHYDKSSKAIKRDLYPMLGNLPIAKINSYLLAQAISATAISRGANETAGRVLTHANLIFNFAKGLGVYQGDNPVLGAREVAMNKPPRSKSFAALLKWSELGAILKKAKGENISPSLYMLHRLIAFTAIRIGTARLAEWNEFDLDSAQPVWLIPRAKMKIKNRKLDHRVPLCSQLTEELRAWKGVGLSKNWLFPSPQKYNRHKPVSSDGLEKVYREQLNLRDMHSPHSWRSSLSTRAKDNGFDGDVVEISLDHCHDDAIAMIYDRGDRYDKRIQLMEWWGQSLMIAETRN